ncbi:hypothetical protein NKJ71_19530 [Mesorhizobium sp. M0050]|uniref:helix-turn-helix domain-containing protein n=1 Tax=Mesorhizobium sp. M0050 TaxID=2956861 RepID=UPI00333A5D09
MRLFASSATERGIRQRGVACFPSETISEVRRRPIVARPAPKPTGPIVIPLTESQEIILSIARKHKLTVAEIIGPRRFRDIAAARLEAVRAVKKAWPAATNEQIGRMFNRHATTIMDMLAK